MNRLVRKACHLALLPTIALVAGCAGGQEPNPAVERAQAAYQTVRNDPAVVRDAALELQRTEEALQSAQALDREGADAEQVEHQAYIASRRAEIAGQTARLREAEQQIAQSDARRSETMLSARTQEAEELRQRLQDMEARQTERGMVLTLGDVLFEVGQANLKPGAQQTIDRLAAFLQEYPDRTVEIAGFTDSTGSAELNQRLSEQRADAVRSALVGRGIDPRRITTRGLGPAMPVASNETAAGRQQNRRVEITILGDQGSVPPSG